jgi:hypothetical protein
MKPSFLRLLPLGLLLLSTGCDKQSPEKYDFDFQFVTEVYKPFNYVESGELTGYAPELLKEICKTWISPIRSMYWIGKRPTEWPVVPLVPFCFPPA